MSFEPVDWPNEPVPAPESGKPEPAQPTQSDDDGDFYGEVPGQLVFDLGPDFDPQTQLNQPATTAGVTAAHHRQLAEQRGLNSKLYGGLLAHGRIPEPAKIVMTRLNILIDRLLGEITSYPRMEFELEFEAAITELLSTLTDQLRETKLIMPDATGFADMAPGRTRP